jgi:hypothetical protein
MYNKLHAVEKPDTKATATFQCGYQTIRGIITTEMYQQIILYSAIREI